MGKIFVDLRKSFVILVLELFFGFIDLGNDMVFERFEEDFVIVEFWVVRETEVKNEKDHTDFSFVFFVPSREL